MKPLTVQENLDLLWETGYTRVDMFFKWYNWAGILAIKNQIVGSPAGRPAKAKS
jgi:tRNA (cmo5U34)-methyltransferase